MTMDQTFLWSNTSSSNSQVNDTDGNSSFVVSGVDQRGEGCSSGLYTIPFLVGYK